MSRNFEFRASPVGHQRGARFVLDGASVDIPIGAPVLVDAGSGTDGLGRLTVKTAVADSPRPKSGMGGIAIWEVGPDEAQQAGILKSWSDFDTVPTGVSIQVVSGDDVKVAFTNTEDGDFYARAGYPAGRVMVATVGSATPGVDVGNYLTPGAGNDSAGWWKFTNTEANAWLVVTDVDNSTGLCEAQFCF